MNNQIPLTSRTFAKQCSFHYWLEVREHIPRDDDIMDLGWYKGWYGLHFYQNGSPVIMYINKNNFFKVPVLPLDVNVIKSFYRGIDRLNGFYNATNRC